MQEIRNDEIEQVCGGTYQEKRDLLDFLNRFFRDHVPFPTPVPREPSW